MGFRHILHNIKEYYVLYTIIGLYLLGLFIFVIGLLLEPHVGSNYISTKIKITKIPVAKINHLIEYSLDNLTTPTEIKINVYKILDTYGPVFDSNYFNESSYVDVTDTKKVKIYNDGTITGSTITVSVTSVQDAYIEMRELLYTLSEEGLSKFNAFKICSTSA